MADFTIKKGSPLSELLVRLIDRDGSPIDLDGPNAVYFIVRQPGATSPKGSYACTPLSPQSDPDTTGKLSGPSDLEVTDTEGVLLGVFELDYGGAQKYVPSHGYYRIEVEDNLKGA